MTLFFYWLVDSRFKTCQILERAHAYQYSKELLEESIQGYYTLEKRAHLAWIQ